MSGMTLWGIESTLLELMELRKDASTQEEIDVIEAQIVEYLQLEVRKVDSCHAVLRNFDARQEAIEEEIMQLSAISKSITKERGRLEDLILGVMQRLGIEKLEGKLGGKFTIKQNPPSVEIRQPEMVPAEYKRRIVTMSEVEYYAIKEALTLLDPSLVVAMIESKTDIPKTEIARALKADIGIPGCELVTDRVRLEVK